MIEIIILIMCFIIGIISTFEVIYYYTLMRRYEKKADEMRKLLTKLLKDGETNDRN